MSQLPSQSPVSSRLVHYILSILLAVLAFIVVLILAFPIGFYGMAMYLEPELPSTDKIQNSTLEMPLQIYSKDNKLIGQYGNRMSLPVTYEEIPDNLIKAFLAAEDSSFYEHSGISTKGLGRAITEIITDQEGQTGGSTITMQVAKNYFLSPERTFRRKLIELYLARKIEDQLSKQEILTLYVNKIYMGSGAYGIKAAAKKYYSKSLDNLTIAEMATLAGLPKAPSQNNPVSNPEASLERRNWILGRMLDLGYITQAQYDDAIDDPIGVHLYKEQLDVNMPYLAEMTRRALVDRFGDEVVNSGWRVKLTVSSEKQSAADTAVKKGLIGYDRRHGWRGAEANGKPLEDFVTHSNMVPAKVTQVSYRSFSAELKNGDVVTVPWSGMSWAKQYVNANHTKGYPNSASSIVKVGDIVRLIANEDQTEWRLTQIPKVQGSLVALDPDTGAVEALVGGFDYRYSKFNRATQGWRQPGSTIKPLNYSVALEKGYRTDSMISDGPLRIGNWRPKNSDGRYYGAMTMRRGLILSRNLVSIRLLQAVGTEEAIQFLDQFGLDKDKLPTGLALALGAGEATPLQMATAYATFANGGHRVQPYIIDQIYDYNNNLLYLANPKRACASCFNEQLDKINAAAQTEYNNQIEAEIKQREQMLDSLENGESLTSGDATAENTNLEQSLTALRFDAGPQSDRLKPAPVTYKAAKQAPRILSENVAFDMASMLRDVVQRGTAKRARALGRSDIGGKTGTTNDMKDAWFAGIHPSQVAVVWLGFDQPSTLGRGEYGGVAALPVWVDYMRTALDSVPRQWFTVSNQAKSKRQQRQVITITNEGSSVTSESTNNSENSEAKTTTNEATENSPAAATNTTNSATAPESPSTRTEPKPVKPSNRTAPASTATPKRSDNPPPRALPTEP